MLVDRKDPPTQLPADQDLGNLVPGGGIVPPNSAFVGGDPKHMIIASGSNHPFNSHFFSFRRSPKECAVGPVHPDRVL